MIVFRKRFICPYIMNYISADPRTTDSLNVWRQPSDLSQVLISTFFFWNAGTKLQKSFLGLLRSLLYQILDHQRGIIPELIKLQGIATVDGLMPTWTRKRIESSLKFVINKTSFPLCLFIDGLDEFDEGEADLLQLINALQSRPSVKICASSRPSQYFINAFKDSAQLKLQDLTRRDIKIYVTDRLQMNPEMATLLQQDPRRGNWLIKIVIAKAEGVFLWVELAVKILLKGLTNKDDWNMMNKRLDLLPRGIESLYIHMWNRLGEDKKLYREQAALYFRIILLQEMSLPQFVTATNENLQSTLLDFKSSLPAIEDVITMCEDAKLHVQTRCAGFLEVDGFDDDASSTKERFDSWSASKETESETKIPHVDEPNKNELDEDSSNECSTDTGGSPVDRTPKDKVDEDELGNYDSDEDSFSEGGFTDEVGEDEAEEEPRLIQLMKWTRVRFIHRTARDFLLDTTDGQAILGENPPLTSSPHILVCKSLLGLNRLLSESSSWNLIHILHRVRDAQIAESRTVEPLMNIIESYFSAKCSGSSANSNWVENYRGMGTAGSWDFGPAKDFLGLAAFYGIYLDLWEGFLSRIKGAGLDYTTYLLFCAVPLQLSGARLELVLILLLNGADPNKIFDPADLFVFSGYVSGWNQFLHGIWTCGGKFIGKLSSTLYETVEAFLNNGADLHENVHISHDTFFLPIWGGKLRMGVELNCELSARYIVTVCLRHNTQFSTIEERFESAGAQASRRLLSAHYADLNPPCDQGPVSEQDFQHISEALDKVLEDAIEFSTMIHLNATSSVKERDHNGMEVIRYVEV